MARGRASREPTPRGFVGRMRHRLGKPASPGEGQYVLAAYAVVTLALVLAPFVTTELPNPTGSQAPDFALPTTTGTTYHLADDFGHRPVMLEFMHPDCPHCQNVESVIATAYGTYGSQIHFVSVAIPLGSFGTPTVEQVQSFVTNYGSQWTYCVSSDNAVASAYGVSGTPTFFFVATNGTVASAQAGEMTDAQLTQALQGLLG